MQRLFLDLMKKQKKRVIGLMSGTSADGIDAALVEIEGHGLETRLQHIAFETTPFDREIRAQLFRLFQPDTCRVDRLCEMNFQLGECFANAALTVIQKAGLTPREIDLIGSHGQTIYHLPPRAAAQYTPSTLQIGEPAVIAHRTGIPTVADFRVADVAAGGQGAPLVPYVDFLLFRQPDRTIALQNIGGISNVTLIPAGADADGVTASDTGPGNMVIDAAIDLLTNGERTYDTGGQMAAQGQVCASLLERWLAHPFLQALPPKTTGREEFGMQFAQRAVTEARTSGISDVDVMATVTEFTAQTIFNHYLRFIFPNDTVDEILISGGGKHNLTLMQRLRTLFQPIPLRATNHSDAKEAVAFAVLANEAVHGHSTNLLQVTGASRRKALGKFVLP